MTVRSSPLAIAFTVVLTVAAIRFAPRLAAGRGAQLISVSEEIALGRQTQVQVRKDLVQLTDPAVVSYVRRIGGALAARAGGAAYPYSFSIANYRDINAFALPGGPVWINRGALSAAANEAQVAAVLAHEVAHVAHRHAADQMTKSLVARGFIGLLGAILGGAQNARTAQLGAGILANGYLLTFSRDDEREADLAGARIMRRAGWDPREMVAFLETLRRVQGRDPGSVEQFLSSHPAPAERVERLRHELRGSTGGRRDSAAFQRVRKRLAGLPVAKRKSQPKI